MMDDEEDLASVEDEVERIGAEDSSRADESGERMSLDSSHSVGSHHTSSESESRLQEVTLYLSQLVGCYDTQTLTDACLGLAVSIHEADEVCLQLLNEKDVVGVIVRLMEELPTHHGLQKILCDILLQCNEKIELRGGVDDHNAYRVVLTVLKRHRDKPELLGKALQVMASIAGTTFREGLLREAMVFTSVLALLRDYPSHLDIQSGGLQALAYLLRSDYYATVTVVLQDDHKLILDSLERHRDNATIVYSALNALEVVCYCDQGKMSLLNSSALLLSVEAINIFIDNEEVVGSACGVINTLAEAAITHPSVQFQTGLEKHQVAELLVTMIQQYSAVLRIQITGLSAVSNILLLGLPSLQLLNHYNILRLVHCAFEAFGTELDLQEVCCRCLARLMEKYQDIHHFIGRDSPKIQFPLHDSVWLVLLDQTKNAHPKLFQSVALALYYLAVDSESLHRVLLEKGAAVAVFEGVREFLHDYSRDELCVEYGCRALVALIMQNCSDSDKDYLYRLNIVDDIITILDMFKYDPGVISEVFGVIACLSNLTEFVETIGINGVHRQILRAVNEYSHHSVLVESGLEVIIMLSQNKLMNQQLNEAAALECTAALMKHHINSPPIQRKGCLVVRLLSSAEHLTSQPVCVSLASAVVGALAQWRTEPEVEVEALVCIHKLCDTSKHMAGALVKRDLHLLLFSMMYDWRGENEEDRERETRAVSSSSFQNDTVESERDFVLRVGTDVLFSLACIHDFKQEMLATAIKDGLLEGVKVLVEDIGADVNVASSWSPSDKGDMSGGRETCVGGGWRQSTEDAGGGEQQFPICLAVLSKMKPMVELLLDLGVTNVHSALKLSREMNLDEITGVLLKNVALDRNGDSVNLSGLKLCTIKPQWILPCLGVSEMSRRNRLHRQSFDKIKDLLSRRKSIGCIEDKNLELLRANMENLIKESDGGASSDTTSINILGGNDEPDSEVPLTSDQPHRPGHHRTQSNNIILRPLESQTEGHNTRNILHDSSPTREMIPRSDRPQSLPPVQLISPAQPNSTEPEQRPHPLSSTPLKLRKTGSSSTFQPTLPPICGTPVGSLQRIQIQPGMLKREGSESSEDLVDSPTSPLFPIVHASPIPARVEREKRGGEDSPRTLVVSINSVNSDPPQPPTPERRHHERLNSIMIQKGTQQNQLFPPSPTHGSPNTAKTTDSSHLQTTESFEEILHSALSIPRKIASVSPALLLRRVSMWHKKRKLKQRKPSSNPFSRPSSPPARIFTDITAHSLSGGESRESTPVSTEVNQKCSVGGILSDEGISTGATPVSARSSFNTTVMTPNTSTSSFPLSPTSSADNTDGFDGGLFSPTGSNTLTGYLQSRRKSSSSISSSSMFQPEPDHGFVVSKAYEMMLRGRSSEVREKITSARLIKVLDLSSNSLNGLEKMIGREEVEPHDREVGELGEMVVKRLKGLQRLDLKQNRLCRLPLELMGEMKKLSILNLSCNSFDEMPAECVLSPALTSIDLSTNKIPHVPDIPTLPNLTKIALSDNSLTKFPTAINGASLPHLKVLSLRSNKIAELVDEDLKLKDLEELYLSKNSIKEIPDHFMVSMITLKILDISHNQLEVLPKDRAEDLVELTTLRMGYNMLGKKQAGFNHFVTSAPVLRTVDATENGLSLIPPPRAWRSCGLKDLRLNGNEITQLDLQDCEKYWPHLETLYIGQNKLREIPKEIGKLRTLSCLDISHNNIRHLPDELGLLDHLFLLNLQGLDKLSLDPALLKGPTKNITAFLKSRSVKSVPCYQMKMMMVGGPGRGKTTLLHQLLQEKISGHSRSNLATLGVNVRHWSYVTDFKTYHINCWDFAGQEEFYSTHQCFLTCRSIYLLIYDISKGESELSCLAPWLLNIQARAPSSPVIVIGTHIDKLNKGEYDFKRLQMRTRIQELSRQPGFPNHLTFSEVDCFNDKMLATLRVKVKEQINSAQLRGQKIMGGLVPHNYMLLLEVIQQEKKRMAKTKSRFPVLTSEKLRAIMAAGKLKMEKMELDQAIRFLHECGVLLHYPDVKSNLSKLFFLEPEWLCSLMAQIITVTEVNPLIDKQGLLQVRSLSHLLKEPKFPSEFETEYIRLLERFEVVLLQTSQTLLIPARLSRKKPASILLPPASAGSQLIRRYLFLYIPPGFWPRLVARLIAFPKRTLPNYIKGNLDGKLEVWAEGIYYFWSEQAFFLVESLDRKTSGLDIVVPTTMIGTKLLCSVVDNIEHLIDEWFPGLRDIDTNTGRELVHPLALCPRCPISCEPHCFHLSDLLVASTNDDHVICPTHNGNVILEQLAPDIIISDLDAKFKILPSDFSIEESSANLLGSGGFGAVYKAMYKGRPVAVKIFSEKTAKINNTTPNYLLRLEVSILAQLEHPHIISLVGVCMRPKPTMLLEYAELGSLRSLHPYNNLNNQLKHRIALQVASALAYLHKHNIIYRDLKADNVLIFSVNLIAKVNAKLSDYGIACTATETGLTQAIGTRTCKAPELLKAPSSYTTYNEKVDVYSYGLLMFTLMSNGHKPHEELNDPYEIDNAIAEGRPIKDLEQYGCAPWPDMQDLVTHCLHYLPNERPSAQEIFDRLCYPEFICLKRAVQMAYDCNMESITVRTFRDKKEASKSVEVWMASTLEQQTMLSIMNLSERNTTPKGFMIPTVKVYSMVAVQTSHVILGTESGHLLVYDGYSYKKSHELSPLRDAILCLQFLKCTSMGSYALYAGIASGQLVIYDEYLIPCADAKPSKVVELGTGPIRSIYQLHDHLYAGCGQDIVVIKTQQYVVDSRWKAVDEPNSFVTCVEASHDTVWSSQNRSPSIQLWDIEDGHKHRGEVNCYAMLRTLLPRGSQVDPRGSRVTSMFLQPHPHSVMWVGLGSGHLLLINALSHNPLMVVHRHVEAIRSLQCHKVPVNDKPVHLILSAGFGFRQRPGELNNLRGTPAMYGNLLVWDSIMPRFKTVFEEMRQQQDLYR